MEKNPLANAGHTGVGDTQVQSLGQEDPLETICLSLQTRHSCTENYEASLRGRHKADALIIF